MPQAPSRQVAQEHTNSPQALRQFWGGGNDHPPVWDHSSFACIDGKEVLDEPYTLLAQAALRFGETFLALDIVKVGCAVLEEAGRNKNINVQDAMIQLIHVKALALARLGSLIEAHELLENATRECESTEIAAGMARTLKDLSFLSPDEPSRIAKLRKSNELYLESYIRRPDAFTGINAAATALWLGEIETARSLAREVRELCQTILQSNPDDVWSSATLAESLLIDGFFNEAVSQYGKARKAMAKAHRWGDIATMRKQAIRHCEKLGLDASLLNAELRQVLVSFSGHMMDRPDRPHPRFPASSENEVRLRIRDALDRIEPAFGYSSAACGSDILFLEEMQRRGADTVVVLPWCKEDFLHSSVRIATEGNWEKRFNDVLDHASSVVYLSNQTEPAQSEITYEYLIECTNGMMTLNADSLSAEIIPLAFWDGAPGDGSGGTSSFVEFWRRRSVEPIIIKPPDVSGPTSGRPLPASGAARRNSLTVSIGQPCIKTMLFADVVGSSKIPERLVSDFVSSFLGSISRLIVNDSDRPISFNTWGDAVFFIFDEPGQAGRFALRMLDEVARVNWKELGFSVDLSFRIGLHTGPMLMCVDPVTRQFNFFGAHVSHAARIEPVVRPGEAWATEAFAAYTRLSKDWNSDRIGFHLDYLGQVDFAKKYGTYPLFRVNAG